MKIGIDIGSATIGLGLVENGIVKTKTSNPSFRKDVSPEGSIRYLENLIDILMDDNVESIGIGVPSVAGPVRGGARGMAEVLSCANISLKDELERHFRIPVSVNNRAGCFALGAYEAGCRQGCNKDEILVGITLGAEPGVGIVCGGKLFNGRNAGAGEICFLPYRDSCLEDYCGSRFFEKAGTTCKEAAVSAGAGHELSLEMFEDFGRHLGHLVTVVLYAYDPDRIVIGGMIANFHPFFMESMKEYIDGKFRYKASLDSLAIDIQTDENTPIIGAANL